MKSQLFATFSSIAGMVVVLLGIVFIGLPAIAGAQDPEPSDSIGAQAAIGTAFTYQGELKKSGTPIADTCDIAFSLYDTLGGSNQVGSAITQSSISVVAGIFITQLDFGSSIFTGEARWLEIAVKCSSDGSFIDLSPRQELTPVPYAIYAQNVSSHTHHSLDAADGSPTDAVYVDNEGDVGIGTTNAQASLHIEQGDLLMNSSQEQGIRMKRTGMSGYPNAEFRLGRVITAGDGSPEFRVLYTDDNITERAVFEFDNKGIVASVKPGVGSHFEGFISGNTQPLFRLNSSPAMQLELGPGGSTKTDVAIRREATKVLTFITGNTENSVDERARIDSNGNFGIGTTSPDNSRLHVASGNNQFIIEDSNGGTDAKQWLFNADANLLKIMTANDGFSSWADALVIERSGVSLVDVSFPTGNVGIGTSTPNSKLQVNGYIQLDTVSSAPPAADCDAASEEGRMKFDPTSDVLYICSGASGWISK